MSLNKKNNNLLQKIRIIIEKNSFIQRSLCWQLFKKWLNRLKIISTIYKNTKWNAIINYIKNDFEYIKIKREIDSFRVGGIYNFNGIKLPLSVITADSFLNVLKPAIENIKYETSGIDKFYSEQKNKYKTLTYWRDDYIKGEPDYIGGHLISHGFTYFFEEVSIDSGDVVIDLGAAPGDFSATCIKNGASKIYAFEPEESNGSNLKKVSSLNDNKIEIVRKYCGAKTNTEDNIVSLDDFVKMKDLKKIDFIKADIEGFEVKALLGAENILKQYKPKLSFCTYHSIDDEKNIEKVIINANPNYKIYKHKGIMYAA